MKRFALWPHRSRQRLIWGLACVAGMVVWGGPECRADSISIIIVANGGLDNIPVSSTGGTSTDFGTANLTALNAVLMAVGSHYQFTALGGTSNFPGAASGGTLTLAGTITLPAGATPDANPVTIQEGETGFTIPSSGSGTLFSSSGATFTGAGSNSSNDVFSGFSSALVTSSYLVTPSVTSGSGSATIPSFTTPYSLVNTITISLTPGGASPGQGVASTVTDAFSITATAKGPVSSVPEPAGWVLVLSGLSLLGIARWRCRAAAPAV